MVRTAAPEHLLTIGLATMAIEGGNTALVLGRDQATMPVSVRMFRSQPTVVTFIGNWWAARLLVFRCLGLGAMVAVRAGGGLADTPQWTDLDRTAGGTGRRVWPMLEYRQPSEASRLLLQLYDVGPAGPPNRPMLGVWHTQLTVLAGVTQAGTAAIAGADIVLSQGLGRADAELVAAARGHGEGTAALLTALEPDMIAACSAGTDRYAWLAPTKVERHLFGDPPRAIAIDPV